MATCEADSVNLMTRKVLVAFCALTPTTYEKDGAVYLRETAHAPNASWWQNIMDPPGAYWNWQHLASNLRQDLVRCDSPSYGVLVL